MAIDRKKLFERCKGYCEKCGGALPDNWAAHHRRLRSQGGKDTLDNVLALHHECHNLATHSVHLNPATARENGWLVSAYADPAQTPVRLATGIYVLLTPEGTYQQEKESK